MVMSGLGKNFNYEEFMKNEFPNSKEKLPEETKLINHLDRITGLLFDNATALLKQKKESEEKLVPSFENIRYTMISNYRIRSISLMKVFSEIFNIDNQSLFDEGTACIITRNMLESFLIYYHLYKEPEKNLGERELKFDLYELSSILQFNRHADFLSKKNGPKEFKRPDLQSEINQLILRIESNIAFKRLPKKIIDSINGIKLKKLSFLSFVNFNTLIINSPLPTNFTRDYYSYASAFAHSEGFSVDMSRMIHQNVENWGYLNKILKFKTLTMCLYLSSLFLLTFIKDEKIEFEDEREKDLFEILSLVNFYNQAMECND